MYEANARSLAPPGDCYVMMYNKQTQELSIALDLISIEDSDSLPGAGEYADVYADVC